MPDDVATRFSKALELRINGDYDEAVTLLKSVIAEQPTNADAFHELGMVYSFQVADECLPTLEYACRLAPQNVKFVLAFAKALAMFGEFDRAKQMFEYILKLDPFHEEAKQQLAYL